MSPSFARIQLLLDQRRYELAQQELESLLASEPNQALAHALLAHCLSEQKQLKRALVHAKMAVGLAPETAFCHYILSIVQQESNQLKEARQSIGQALELNPEDPDFFARLGLICLLESRWQEALNCAEQALALDPEHIDSQNLRSMALMRMGQPNSALDQLEQALLKDPENGRVHANRGWTLLHAGKPDEAMQAFSEALRLEPEMEWAREGMLESLKARHWIYRQFLKYSFWMSRWGSRHQFLILIAILLGMRLLVGLVGQASTSLAVGVMLIYAGLVALSWLADPLFNLLLLFHPFGRFVLAPYERRGALWIAGLLSAGLTGSVLGVALQQLWLGLLGLLSLLLLLPVAGTFSTSQQNTRISLGVYSLVLAGFGLSGIASIYLGLPGVLAASFFFFALGLIAFSWVANALLLKA